MEENDEQEITVDIVEDPNGNALEGTVLGCGILAALYGLGYVALRIFGVL